MYGFQSLLKVQVLFSRNTKFLVSRFLVLRFILSGDTRERLPGEIIPTSAENSRTFLDREERYAASRAIDLKLSTTSATQPGADGKLWLKVKLDKAFCIHQVVWMVYNGKHHRSWTCSFSSCSSDHNDYSLMVLSERASTDSLPPVADCTYGDTVMLQTTIVSNFHVAELAVIGTEGEIRCFKFNYVRFEVITALLGRKIMRCYGRISFQNICKLKTFIRQSRYSTGCTGCIAGLKAH